MKNKLTKATTALIALFILSGCATIFKGSSADIKVNSTPSGAEVWINDINKGTTPQTMSLKRDQNHVLEFRMDGYEPVRIEVNKKFDAATTIVGNIFSWALLGIVVDVATGAAYSLNPHDVQANMKQLQAAGYIPNHQEMSESDIHIMMISAEDWVKIKK